jgi:exopolyphosphatase/guanosine-5'-triphosphate,3'-diphosphate pyrophosphatase
VTRTIEALGRFRQIAKAIGVKKLTTVATAAVRDAIDGPQFLKQIAALGLKPRLLTGTEEALFSGLGVVSAIPRASGIVADLGGGSLELVGVARGGVGNGVSLPLGVLRVGSAPDQPAIEAAVREALGGDRLIDAARDHGLYLVGGSFRALAQLDLKLTGHPLPILHQHRLGPDRLIALGEAIRTTPPEALKQSSGLPRGRIEALPAAHAILSALVAILGPRRVLLSAFGLREGLLYRDLPPDIRDDDPLLAAALEVGERLGRFGDHGAMLDQWIAPLFPDDSHELQRYRLATCLLGDIGWNAHPDFRAERAVDMAVHGNWVGIDAHGRALIGRALCSAFGGDGGFSRKLGALLRPGEDERAMAWGRAIRLAQRLSGGTEPLLRRSSIRLVNHEIRLSLPARYRALYSEAVERRLGQLGKALGRAVAVDFA